MVSLEKAKQEIGLEDITVIRRENPSFFRKIINFLKRPNAPITLAPYAKMDVARQLGGFLEDRTFSHVVYDGLHSAAWKLSSIKLRNSQGHSFREVYRAHNVESNLWFQAAKNTSSLLKRMLLNFQGNMIKRFEVRLTRECGFIFPVSNGDAKVFSNYLPKGELKTLPIGMDIKRVLKSSLRGTVPKKRKFLFVGKLDWPPNRDGLKWVLDKVWPEVIQKTDDAELSIVGSGESAWIKPYCNLPGIRFVGAVESVVPYYEKTSATLVPVFYGSGTRVKAIESCLFGKVCISTTLGVEGLGLVDGQNVCLAEKESDWIRALTSFDDVSAKKMGNLAHAHASRTFNPLRIADQFIESVLVSKKDSA
jgi:hypothetical protein